MKNKKGFTLIELLGVVILLAIVISIAVVSYSSHVTKTKIKAFKIEEANFIDATQAAYIDCFSNNPTNNFCGYHKHLENKYTYEIVYLKELIDDSYIDPIKNPYDIDKFCNIDKSYVYASRKNSSQSNNADMVYKACLICGDNKSEDCLEDEELEQTTFETTCHAYYDAVGGPTYDGEWTDRDVYLVFGASGNYRYGIDEFEYKINNSSTSTIDGNRATNTAILRLNKSVGNKSYTVQAFDGMNGLGTIVSCGASVKIDKDPINSVTITAKTASGLTPSSDKWVAEKVTLTANVNPTSSTSGYIYQWYKDGVEYGSTTTSNKIVISEAGNYKVKVTNKVGKIFKTSSDLALKIDVVIPKCELAVTSGTLGKNNWYTSNVTIGWKTGYPDGTGSNIVTSGIDPANITSNGTYTVTAMVTDQAGNVGTCSLPVKVDKSTSSSSNLKTIITANDSIASGSWHKADTTLTVSGAQSTSGITYYIDTNNPPTTKQSSVSITSNTSSTTYYARACNGAGICGEITSYELKLDETKPGVPTLAIGDNIASGNWHIKDFSLSLSGANNISGYTYYIDTNSNPTTARSSVTVSTNTASTTYYYKVCSGAGKCSTVGSYVAKLDNSTPTITAKSSSNYITTSTGKAISSYFNISYGVSSGSVICKVGSTTVSNTNNLSLGVNTVTCTATSGAGLTKSASTVFRHQYTASISCSRGTYSSSSGKCEDDWYDSCAYTEDVCVSGYEPDYVCGSKCTAYNYSTECETYDTVPNYESPSCSHSGCSCEITNFNSSVNDWECCWEEQGSCKSWQDVWCDGAYNPCLDTREECVADSGTDYYDPTYSCPHGGTRSGTTCSF